MPAGRFQGYEAVVTRLVLCGLLGLCVAKVAADQAREPATAAGFARPVLIRFEGMITPLSEQSLYRKLEKAKSYQADLVIIEIDSPGGYVESSLNMADRFRRNSWCHLVAYVPDGQQGALSGAAIMALGCDEIVMHPKARIGDAGPIFQGEDALFRHAPEKIRSDLVRRVRDLAEANGFPPALVEAMVDDGLVVYHVTQPQSGKTTLMSEAELNALAEPAVWEKGPPVQESRQGLFLELNGVRAVELKLATGTVDSRTALFERLALKEKPLVLETTSVDRAVMILNLPLVTGLLLVIGLIALYVEFSAPGVGVGGLISGLCFVLFFWSRFWGGTSGWLEVILFAAGIIFIAMEFFVIPGFGIAGITGLLLVLASLVMAGEEYAQSDGLSTREVTIQLLVVMGAGATSVVVIIGLSTYLGEIPLFHRLTLKPPTADELLPQPDSDAKSLPARPGLQVQVGDWGVAESPLRPAGKALFSDEYFDVVTDGSFVAAGTQVRVLQISGNRIVVREIEEPT